MDETKLIKEALEGNDEAFAALIGPGKDALFNHLYSMTHDEGTAEELAQEAFLTAFRHLDTFRMESSFSTWLWRIAHNLCLNYLKKQHVTECVFKEEITAAKLSQETLNEELEEKIEEAVKKLPKKQRQVFEMVHFDHIPQKQIAAQLRVKEGTVRSRLFYARKKIRKLIQKGA